MSKEGLDEQDRDKEKARVLVNRGYHQKKEEDIWGSLIFGLIGAVATTFAITRLRRISVDWIFSQMSRSQSSRTNDRSFRSSFQEESRKRYNRRMQEEYEEELERLERIKRMQSVFNRERNKFKRSYESWQEHSQGRYHQQNQRNDWYWKGDASSSDQGSNFKEAPRASSRSSSLSHHYSVLGLDSRRTKPYTNSEIKAAFQAKAKEYHPDLNQDNKEFAEAKFKELMVSHKAILSERQNSK